MDDRTQQALKFGCRYDIDAPQHTEIKPRIPKERITRVTCIVITKPDDKTSFGIWEEIIIIIGCENEEWIQQAHQGLR